MSENEGIVQFKYENGNIIIYNPDIHSVIETIKVLNKNDDVEFIEDDVNTSNDKYVFKNQRFHTLAREYLDKEFGPFIMYKYLMSSSNSTVFFLLVSIM
jgi:hypothetical protein